MRLCFLATLLISACDAPAPEATLLNGPIVWVDGDSGTIGGSEFRLANVDAPETGPIGASGGALCDEERQLGFVAKAFMARLTAAGQSTVVRASGQDRYGRRIVSITVDGRDIGETAIAAGHLRSWPHQAGEALRPKPNWCQGRSRSSSQ